MAEQRTVKGDIRTFLVVASATALGNAIWNSVSGTWDYFISDKENGYYKDFPEDQNKKTSLLTKVKKVWNYKINQ